ncbi:hypothetical protein, partial [Rhizobium lentis]|uniref:hypothetical protein n=1 Tax=Rhizobium lentis TaxID=1138194 RepID=UPI0038FD3D0D
MLSAAADPASAGFRTDYALKTLRGVFEAKVGDKLDAVLRSPGYQKRRRMGATSIGRGEIWRSLGNAQERNVANGTGPCSFSGKTSDLEHDFRRTTVTALS